MRGTSAQGVLIRDIVSQLAEVGDRRVVIAGQTVRLVGVFKVGFTVELVMPPWSSSCQLCWNVMARKGMCATRKVEGRAYAYVLTVAFWPWSM